MQSCASAPPAAPARLTGLDEAGVADPAGRDDPALAGWEDAAHWDAVPPTDEELWELAPDPYCDPPDGAGAWATGGRARGSGPAIPPTACHPVWPWPGSRATPGPPGWTGSPTAGHWRTASPASVAPAGASPSPARTAGWWRTAARGHQGATLGGVLHPSARREVAPTPLARRPCEEAAPIALAAPGALSALIAVRHLDLAPVVQSNQATPIFCHDAFPLVRGCPLWPAASRRAWVLDAQTARSPRSVTQARALVRLQPKAPRWTVAATGIARRSFAFQHVALRHPPPQAAPPRPAIVEHRGNNHQHEEAAEEGQDDHGSPSLPSLYVLAIVSPGVRPCIGQPSRHARRRSCRGHYYTDRQLSRPEGPLPDHDSHRALIGE